MRLRLVLLAALLGGLGAIAAAQERPADTGKRYTLRTIAVRGTTPTAGEVADPRLPLDKPYAELTAEQREALRATYVGLAADDEPPFPLRGLRGIVERIRARHRGGAFEGDVYVEVTVDASGNATEVAVRRSPGDASLALVAGAAMEAGYKPALCAGTPCAMAFPFVVHFNPSTEAAERRSVCLDGAARPEARVSACTALLDSRELTRDSETLMLRQRAYALDQLGDHARASTDHDEVVRRLPADPAVYASRAAGRGEAGEWSAAADDYDTSLRLAPGHWNREFLRLRALDRAGRVDDAGAAYDALMRRAPRTSDEYVARADAAASRADFEQARAALDRAVELDDRNGQARLLRADLRLAAGDTAGALDDAGHATRLWPKWASALLTRGIAHYIAGQYDAAVADFDEALLAAPGHRYLPIWRGLARLHGGHAILARAQMSRDLAGMDGARWPAPVLALLIGRLDAAALDAAAQTSDRAARAGRECEAQFYRAEALLVDRREAEARPAMESAARTCPPTFIEAYAARAELKRLSP